MQARAQRGRGRGREGLHARHMIETNLDDTYLA